MNRSAFSWRTKVACAAIIKLVLVVSAIGKELPDYSESFFAHEIPMIGCTGGELRLEPYYPRELSSEGVKRFGRNTRIASFWIGKYELRLREYREWLQERERMPVSASEKRAHAVFQFDDRNHGPWVGANFREISTKDHPIVGVNQWSGKRFCHWISMRTGKFYRLPTEAEWELACRAGNNTGRYPWGDSAAELSKFAVTNNEGDSTKLSLQPVGTKTPNAWGIYDMIGNAEEWVADGFNEDRDLWQSNDPITWPASRKLSQSPEKLWQEFKAGEHRYCDGWGVAKGGSSHYARCQEPICFTVCARTNPSIFSNQEDPDIFSQDAPRELVGEGCEAVGFRIARPLVVPERKIQLWHWGLYFDHEKWRDLTLEPTPTSPAGK